MRLKDEQKKSSEEVQKFLDDLQKQLIRIEPVKPIYPDDDFEKEFREIPRFVLFLCKILNFILNYGGFLFAIVGGIFSLIWAYGIWQLCADHGWRGLFETKNTLYIIAYLVLLFVINKIRFLLFKIIDEN